MSFPGLWMGKPEMALGAGKNFGPSWIAIWVDNERQEPRLRMGTWGVKLTELDSGAGSSEPHLTQSCALSSHHT